MTTSKKQPATITCDKCGRTRHKGVDFELHGCVDYTPPATTTKKPPAASSGKAVMKWLVG